MYERFTDSARAVMQLAHTKAREWRHECVGPEHILLAILSIPRHCGAREIIDKLRKNKDDSIINRLNGAMRPGLQLVAMESKLPQTPRTKKVVQNALDYARQFNQNYIGTEHLLLGIAAEAENVAYQVLKDLGIFSYLIYDEVKSRGKATAQDVQRTKSIVSYTGTFLTINDTREAEQKLKDSNDPGAGVLLDVLEAIRQGAVKQERDRCEAVIRDQLNRMHADGKVNETAYLVCCLYEIIMPGIDKNKSQEKPKGDSGKIDEKANLLVNEWARSVSNQMSLDWRPNPKQNLAQLAQELKEHFSRAGIAYVWWIRNSSFAPYEVYALDPYRLQPVAETGGPGHYKYHQEDGTLVHINLSQVERLTYKS